MIRYRFATLAVFIFLAPLCLRAADPSQRLITVNGEGEVQADPDRAVLSFAIETNDKDLDAAKRDNDQRSRKVVSTIKTFRIDPKDLRTDQLQVEPRYQNYPSKDFQGYFVRNSMTLTVRDLAKFEAIYDSLLKSGAEYVTDLRFETAKLAEKKTLAREAALKNAEEKARAMAKVLGQTIGKPVTIQEGGGHVWPMDKAFGAMGMRAAAAEAGPAIATGQITVRSDVTVAFELKD